MKINETTSQRMYPRRLHGAFPELDMFIDRNEAPDGSVQPDPKRRWRVDAEYFPNLTEAREHVRDTLQLHTNDELGSPTLYTPATGWTCTKTKGSDMNTQRKTMTPEDVAPKLEQAKLNLQRVEGQLVAGLTGEALVNQQRMLAAAKGSVKYYTKTLDTARHNHANPEPVAAVNTAGPNAETFVRPDVAPQPQAEIQHLPRHIERLGEPRRMPRYEIAIPTAAGRAVSVRVNDSESLDEVFMMIKKHNL